MDKAYTYADFITESLNYRHSQDYYNTMKEMAEIELMESYLSAQQFLVEEAGYYDFSEGVLMETGDTDSVKTKLGEKAKNLLKKIVEGIKKAWSVFISFITSIPDKVKSLISKIKGTKAAESLQFVVDKAKSDLKNTEILFKQFKDIIDIPDIYKGWAIAARKANTRAIKDISYNDRAIVSILFKEFLKSSRILADYINDERESEIYVSFEMKPDRNKSDKPVTISYVNIYNAVEIVTKRMTELKDIDKVLDKVERKLATPNIVRGSYVEVLLTNRMDIYDFMPEIKRSFTKKMDSFLSSVHLSSNVIDIKDLRCFNEINQLLTWAISEYMTASNHAFKLINDIVKVSEKIEEAYEEKIINL